MIFEPFKPFLASAYQIKFATEAWEKLGAATLRRQVFCVEQGLFDGNDRDAVDDVAIPLVAISLFGVAADAVSAPATRRCSRSLSLIPIGFLRLC